MKRIFTVILVFVASICFAQKGIKLKMNYIPNHSYSIQVNNVTNMVMDAEMDSVMKSQLTASGMSFPMEVSAVKDMTALLKTGEANDKKEIPFTMEYTNFVTSQKMAGREMPGGGESLLKGLKASGWSDHQGKLRIESVEGTDMSEEVKKVMMTTFDQVGTQVVFPDKELKQGDEFVHEVPLEMTVASGVSMKMLIKTTYKLKSYNKENAFFDTVIEMRMDMALDVAEEKGNMNVKGAGKGVMVFDIAKNYVSSSTADIDMTMNLMTGPMEMNIKANSKSDTKVSHL